MAGKLNYERHVDTGYRFLHHIAAIELEILILSIVIISFISKINTHIHVHCNTIRIISIY